MSWGMQVNLGGTWEWLRPSNGTPYTYYTKDQAEHMLYICYPDQIRQHKLGGECTVRVQEFKE